jgi:hypothetical protein
MRYAAILLLSVLFAGPVAFCGDDLACSFLQASRRQRGMVRRGRPPKFGRPARSIALTLPHDVIGNLTRIDGDVARAVVALVDRESRGTSEVSTEVVDLLQVSRNLQLIVVDQQCFRTLPACTLVPLTNRWAFLAFEPGAGLRELELGVVDRLEDAKVEAEERLALNALRRALQKWRRDPWISVENRSIVFVEHKDRVRSKRSARSS